MNRETTEQSGICKKAQLMTSHPCKFRCETRIQCVCCHYYFPLNLLQGVSIPIPLGVARKNQGSVSSWLSNGPSDPLFTLCTFNACINRQLLIPGYRLLSSWYAFLNNINTWTWWFCLVMVNILTKFWLFSDYISAKILKLKDDELTTWHFY